MRKVAAKFAILAAVAGIGMSAGNPPWMKLDAAKAAAAVSGLPIAVYATVNAEGGS